MRFNDIYTRHAYNMAKAQFLCAPGSGCDMIVQSMIFGWTNTPTIYMYMDILIYFHSFASYRHCYGWFIKIVLRLNMNTHFFFPVDMKLCLLFSFTNAERNRLATMLCQWPPPSSDNRIVSFQHRKVKIITLLAMDPLPCRLWLNRPINLHFVASCFLLADVLPFSRDRNTTLTYIECYTTISYTELQSYTSINRHN